jgi:putative ABC transport system ATP-binding protein
METHEEPDAKGNGSVEAEPDSEPSEPKAQSKSKSKDADKKPKRLLVELRSVSKTYHRGDEPIHVLDGLDLALEEGSFVALMGPSGSGKSTLLNIVAGLDQPSKGTAFVAGQELTRLSEGELAKFRSRTIGFVFQSYNLLPVLTAVENVELPLQLTHLDGKERRKRAGTALRVVGLEDRSDHYPRQLSGGQEQRVAIARAIVNDPTIIVADEPTGDLDRQSAEEIMGLLEKLNREFNKTILMVTHDPEAADHAQRTVRLNKGRLE